MKAWVKVFILIPLAFSLLLVGAVNDTFARDLGSGQVVRVVDGDTLVVELNGREETVRLIGIDTPETKHPEKPVEPWGPEAEAFLKALLPPGSAVRLELGIQERDRYGRTLAYVYLPADVMVNGLLLSAGLAELLTIPPNVEHVDLFRRLQDAAKAACLGVWSDRCGAPSPPREGVFIDEVNKVAEYVEIHNGGSEAISLTGWSLVSVLGCQRYTLQDIELRPGESVIVTSNGDKRHDPPAIWHWTGAHIWNNGEEDPAALYDDGGELVSVFPRAFDVGQRCSS